MIAIAESGSSKTSWVIINPEGKKIDSFSSSGLNPYTQSKEQILGLIKEEISSGLNNGQVEEIYFYGAGCSTEDNKEVMRSSFRRFFSKRVNIVIEHDLLAAARALYHDTAGIAIILGTGSNSCVYDGKDIAENVRSLGWMIGDEGSGAYMGKALLRDFMYNRLPKNLSERLEKDYKLNTDIILDRIYKKANPNRWLASMSVFIRDHIDEEYCRTLVHKSFYDFFETQVSQYRDFKDLPLSAVGSIGYYYKDILKEVSDEFGFELKKVIKAPVNELVKYHINQLKVAQDN